MILPPTPSAYSSVVENCERRFVYGVSCMVFRVWCLMFGVLGALLWFGGPSAGRGTPDWSGTDRIASNALHGVPADPTFKLRNAKHF
jgi:hypothetical protein